MSSGLSQAEIDALLSGNSIPADEPSPEATESETAAAEAEPPMEDMPAELEAAPAFEDSAPEASTEAAAPDPEPAPVPEPDDVMPFDPDILSSVEIDAIGEIGNISMGTAATTLFTLLNKRVDITTPRVKLSTMRQIASEYPLPFVAVQVAYTVGLVGNNILFMKETDVKIITDLMMGGDGTNTDGELNDLHLSAISEVMNQMVGSASTSLAKLIDSPIDIAPPHAYTVNLADEVTQPHFSQDEPLVKTSFTMEIEGLINSEIMQIMPVEFAKSLVTSMLNAQSAAAPPPPPPPEPAKPAAPPKAKPAASAPPAVDPGAPRAAAYMDDDDDYEPEPRRARKARPMEGRMVDVRPVQYDSFDEEELLAEEFGDNMQLLLDVPLQVTVELGKSKKFIREILDFNIGTIIVLDKMAGEMVDVVVNGKLIARGEVVVIDDNYGARITDIVSPAKRINPNK